MVASLAMGSVSGSLGGIPLSVSMDAAGGIANVEFEASSESYYILLFGESVMDFEPVALIDGSRDPGIFPAIDSTGSKRSGFFAIQSFSLSEPHDADLDGMDDVFESGWPFLDPFDPMDAEGDQDGDGLTNFEEYLRGTNPSSRDSYILESLSETVVVGKVSSVVSVRTQVPEAGLRFDGALLVLETVAPGGEESSTMVNVGPSGLLHHAVPVLPGTTKVTVRGRSSVNELVYFISSAKFLPVPNPGQDFIAGDRGAFLATVEGTVPSWWTSGGTVDVVMLNDRGDRRETLIVGENGIVSFSPRIPPGLSTIRFSSPVWPGQGVTFAVLGKTAVAGTLEIADRIPPGEDWLTARSPRLIRVKATSSDGQGLGGVELSLVVQEGTAIFEPSVGFTILTYVPYSRSVLHAITRIILCRF
jgi:hypothetical protein